MHRAYFQTAQGQIHARVGGDSGPNVVLLHESPLSSFVYDDVIPLLESRYRVLAPDTLGYGMSDAPPRRLDIPGYAEPVVDLLRSLDGPAVVVGSHTGASIAIEAAHQAPELVSGLVLLGIATYTPEQQRDRRENWAPDEPVTEEATHLLSAWQRYQGLWRGCDLETRQRAVWTMLGSLSRYHWAYNSAFEYDPLTPLSQVTCPVLCVAADGEFLEEGTRRAAADLGLPYEVVPDCIGQIPVRQPKVCADLIERFVSSAVA
ncbi:alpha/beta fold hydrolase [Dactylosporangium sp. CS-033363]|uniref:alpha/beta fold hydrolase n=1 Tax=Dactylosporangium sp. CS-033363 TaxID=3239935 RepID=UPI003D8A625F